MINKFGKDPLDQILEHHLFAITQENQKSPSKLVDTVVNDYMKVLRAKGVHIPGPVKASFIEDLREEVRDLTIKKTFGRIQPELPTHQSHDSASTPKRRPS